VCLKLFFSLVLFSLSFRILYRPHTIQTKNKHTQLKKTKTTLIKIKSINVSINFFLGVFSDMPIILLCTKRASLLFKIPMEDKLKNKKIFFTHLYIFSLQKKRLKKSSYFFLSHSKKKSFFSLQTKSSILCTPYSFCLIMSINNRPIPYLKKHSWSNIEHICFSL